MTIGEAVFKEANPRVYSSQMPDYQDLWIIGHQMKGIWPCFKLPEATKSSGNYAYSVGRSLKRVSLKLFFVCLSGCYLI